VDFHYSLIAPFVFDKDVRFRKPNKLWRRSLHSYVFIQKCYNLRMVYATLAEEKKLWKGGYRNVACLDEAGRGPLAGPVVAGAISINWRTLLRGRNVLPNIKDSKQLSAKQREEFYKILTNHPDIKWGIGIVSEKVIDKINILEATKLAMIKAVRCLEAKYGYLGNYERRIFGMSDIPQNLGGCRTSRHSVRPKIDFLILDGKMKIDLPIPQKSIVKADEKVFSCAAASIIAKVTRDRIMMEYHKKYPEYRFDKHKGYGTKLHYQMLELYGSCQIHRKSYNLFNINKLKLRSSF